MNAFAPASAAILATVFLIAGLSKARSLGTFVEGLADFRLIPKRAVVFVGQAVVVAELATGVGVIVAPPYGALLAALLLCVFTAVVLISIARGNGGISCACFGQSSESPIGPHLVVRNVGLAALAPLAAAHDIAAADAQVVPGTIAVVLYFTALQLTTESLRLRSYRQASASPLRGG